MANAKQVLDLYGQVIQSFESAYIPMISKLTAARICAVLYEYGNDERMVLSPKITLECKHIQKMYHLDGGEVPDKQFAQFLKESIRELQGYRKLCNTKPQWAINLFQERYGIDITNNN